MPEAPASKRTLPAGLSLPWAPAAEEHPDLFAWQQDALDAWHANQRRGVVQAVTGAGKTRVGLVAVHEAFRIGLRSLVVVPTMELQQQWSAALRGHDPRMQVGLLGGGHDDAFVDHHVLVAVVNTAATREGRSEGVLGEIYQGLLVADEVHRYAAPSFVRALSEQFDWRLGLTATYERTDAAQANQLDPFFGGVVASLWYDRALEDGVIAPFEIHLASVDLTPGERAAYDEACQVIAKSGLVLERYLGVSRRHQTQFMAAVARAAKRGSGTAEEAIARRYVKALSEREGILANSRVKRAALQSIVPAIDGSAGTLVFSLTVDAAEAAQELIIQGGITAGLIHSGMAAKDRRRALGDFRRQESAAIVAAKVLDEGIDVPAADLAVNLASHRQERQLIQRLGRVIRRKTDGSPGRFVHVYARNRVEDPDANARGLFGRVNAHATSVQRWILPRDGAALCAALLPAAELPAVAEVPPEQASGIAAAVPEEREPTPRRVPASVAGEPSAAVEPPSESAPQEADREEEPELDVVYELVPRLPDGLLTADAVRDYLKKIGRFALLSAQEEVELAQDIEAGVYATHLLEAGAYETRRRRRDLETMAAAGILAQERFVGANLRLVVSLAKRYTGRGMEFLDLIQEGNLGLQHACLKFDYKQGLKFSTYATWWIRQAITRGMADKSRTIRLPVHLVEQLMKLDSAVREQLNAGAEKPEVETLAKTIDLEIFKVRQLNDWRDMQPRSLEPLVTPEFSSMQPLLDDLIASDAPETQIAPDPAVVVGESSARSDFRAILASVLTEREVRVMRRRFGFHDGAEWTLEAIGQAEGVTRERIRQIARDSLKKLRGEDVPSKRKRYKSRA